MMDVLKNSNTALACFVIAAAAALSACQSHEAQPTSAQIESVAMTASQLGAAKEEHQLSLWALQGLPVAQRELGLLYRPRPDRRAEALQLFQQAARAGDTEAAFQLGEMYRNTVVGVTPSPAQAWPWYQLAAEKNHPQSALMLGLLARNGEGVACASPRSLATVSHLATRTRCSCCRTPTRQARACRATPPGPATCWSKRPSTTIRRRSSNWR